MSTTTLFTLSQQNPPLHNKSRRLPAHTGQMDTGHVTGGGDGQNFQRSGENAAGAGFSGECQVSGDCRVLGGVPGDSLGLPGEYRVPDDPSESHDIAGECQVSHPGECQVSHVAGECQVPHVSPSHVPHPGECHVLGGSKYQVLAGSNEFAGHVPHHVPHQVHNFAGEDFHITWASE
jgi:hypothetical protein